MLCSSLVNHSARTLQLQESSIRFLEHARVFVFGNGGNHQVFLASADWMNRNLNSRIELCFPLYNESIKKEVMDILQLQLTDNTSARHLDKQHNNLLIQSDEKSKIRAQTDTYNLLKA